MKSLAPRPLVGFSGWAGPKAAISGGRKLYREIRFCTFGIGEPNMSKTVSSLFTMPGAVRLPEAMMGLLFGPFVGPMGARA